MISQFKLVCNNDNYQVFANQDIKRGTVILIEKPIYIANDIIELLYLLLKNKNDNDLINLYPRNEIKLINFNNNPYNINLIKVINKSKLYVKFFNSINIDTLYQYYYKILFNAFEMNNKACILKIGAMMNHSCNPNIKFYEHNNNMIFESLVDIKKNTELCYSYLRNNKTNIDNHTYLLNHYNFNCTC
jgi:hypothetical protein